MGRQCLLLPIWSSPLSAPPKNFPDLIPGTEIPPTQDTLPITMNVNVRRIEVPPTGTSAKAELFYGVQKDSVGTSP